ncbi:MAG: heme exporter protein CcmB [Flavobacteriales bacterium]|nr:heme exporter protein CcmB [Flavobacteriales bacterium]MBP9081341.1 heme exporter protein CcmB [Flavobacteriales bacterium]
MQSAEIAHLLRLEWQLDRRQKHVWGSMALYVVSTVYVCYQGVRHLFDVPIWNALFWIILLFAAFNALGRSFQRENQGRQLYLYTLASPRSVVLARTVYNGLIMAVLSLLSLAAYALFIGSSPLDAARLDIFLLVVVIGGTGFALVLTLISALAARAGNGIGLMAILGFPIVLPMLLSLMKASKLALDGLGWNVTGQYVLWLVLIDLITVALAWLLFPYLWRD